MLETKNGPADTCVDSRPDMLWLGCDDRLKAVVRVDH
jgi:hypothetical protein